MFNILCIWQILDIYSTVRVSCFLDLLGSSVPERFDVLC